MPIDPSDLLPADDSGSATFERYCYQAHVAFPYCLNCALGGDVIRVVAEHVEDVAVQFAHGWRFLQIKTRDLEKGPWKMGDFTGKGGGLQSLLRAHRVLRDSEATLELHVEGAIHRKDIVQKLLTEEGRLDGPLGERLQRDLKLDQAECTEFIKRVRLIPAHPTRSTIQAQNLRLLVNHAGYLPAATLEDIYDRMMGLIFQAMQAKLLPPNWRKLFLTQGTLRGKAQALFLQKCLSRDSFKTIVTPITASPQPLLKRFTENVEQPPTLLEQKLIMGGASADIINHAKSLRAFASKREFELMSSQMYESDVLEDVKTRLLMRSHGLVNQYGSGKAPAATIWNALMEVLSQQHLTIDSHALFQKDPDLLLGEICHLSDQCQTSWGIADA